MPESKGTFSSVERVIAYVGLPGFLVLYLLGALPWLPSPIGELKAELHVTRSAMEMLLQQQREQLRIWRMICRGVWKDNNVIQTECGANGK